MFSRSSAGEEAKRVFNDAQNMLNKVIKEKLFKAVGHVGFYPANSRGDDIDVYSPTDGGNKSVSGILYGIRQQVCGFCDLSYTQGD